MKEQLLQFIWRYQYFNRVQLCTEAGEQLQILSPGEINTHQGPDFLQAVIRIGNTCWAGNIELHIKASDWKRHAHQHDKHYNNVILHVVWENDMGDAGETWSLFGDGLSDGWAHGGRNIPLLVLQHRVPKLLLGKYEEWMNRRSFIACERQLPQVGRQTWIDWKRKLLEERLYRRTHWIRDNLEQSHQHWEAVTWWLLARNFGLPVNTLSFEAMARSIPLPVLVRHRERVDQLEALLLGQTGLLEGDMAEAYPLLLQREFRHLRAKYRLPVHSADLLFLRMRPGNMPAVRLAQLAGLVSRSGSLFARVKEAASPEELRPLLTVAASSYWDTHYSWSSQRGAGGQWGSQQLKSGGEAEKPDEAGPFERRPAESGGGMTSRPKITGKQMVESILINTAVPLLFAYGVLRGEKGLKDKALRWLEAIPSEKNALVTGWGRQGVNIEHAADTQALLELKTRYCDPKRCLQCNIGHFLLGEAG